MRVVGKPGLIGLALAVLLLGAREAACQDPLTNADVIRMVRADLPAAIIKTTVDSAAVVAFDVSPDALIALKAAGVPPEVIMRMQARAAAATTPTAIGAPEQSAPLALAQDAPTILRTFKTMVVDAREATFFGSAQVTAALRQHDGFAALGVTIVDDATLADVVLTISYTFAWDYPYKLVHQRTSAVLLSGTGQGPFSGPAGASSVAASLVKQLKPYRAPAAAKPSGPR